MGAEARLQEQNRNHNPFKFPNPNPKDNAPWSNWNHGWSWADAQLMLLKRAAKKGIAADLGAAFPGIL